ncbi:MAG: hypothetical protein WCT19_02645 [Candidatus Paceibacterota bacterium]
MEPTTTTPATGGSKNVIYIILAVIIVAVIAYFVFMGGGSTPATTTGGTPSTGNTGTTPVAATPQLDAAYIASKKAEILKRVSDSKPLTDTEKRDIFQAIAGEKLKQFNFTQAEQTKILNAMNK